MLVKLEIPKTFSSSVFHGWRLSFNEIQNEINFQFVFGGNYA